MSQQKGNSEEEKAQDPARKVELVIQAINDIYCNFFPNSPVVSMSQQLITLLDLSLYLKDMADTLHLTHPIHPPPPESDPPSEQYFRDGDSYKTGKVLIRLNDPNITHLVDTWMHDLHDWVTSEQVAKEDLSLSQIVLITTIAHEQLGKGIERAMKLMGIEIIGKTDHPNTEEKSGNANH